MADIVGQVKIDFEVIPTYEIRTLKVMDSSDWKYLINEESVIGITLPGSKKEILHTFKKKSVNTFNSNNLGLSCLVECEEQEYVPIPDGLYTITLYSSSEFARKKKFFFKTDNLQLEVDTLALKVGFEYNKNDSLVIDSLQKIQFFLNTTQSSIRVGDCEKAQRNYEIAKRLTEDLQECKNCF